MNYIFLKKQELSLYPIAPTPNYFMSAVQILAFHKCDTEFVLETIIFYFQLS